MKPLPSSLLALLLVGTFSACSTQPNRVTSSPVSPTISPTSSQATSPTPTVSPTAELTSLKAEPYTTDELFQQGGGGCGMALWNLESDLPPKNMLFSNGIADKPNDALALMKINGKWVRLRRSDATGEDFYGQKTSQTFVSQDDTIQVQVDVNLGKPGEIESVAIDQGTLRVKQNEQVLEIPVRGGAGC